MNWDHTPDYGKRPLGPRKQQDGKYDGFGCCIYCRRQNVKLFEEHVIPEGLGSHWAIRDGSCEACMKKTHAFEGKAMHHTFLHQRLNAGWKKTTPQKISYVKHVDGIQFREERHPKETPFIGQFPVMLPPRILMGLPISLEDIGWVSHFGIYRRVPKGEGYTTTIQPDMASFSKMIIKIAYCHAVVKYGMDVLHAEMAIDHMLGIYDFGFDYLVGSDVSTLGNKDPTPAAHFISMRRIRFWGMDAVAGNVRLCISLGPPTYVAWIGMLGRPEGG